MNKYQKILIERYKYHDEFAKTLYLSKRNGIIHACIMGEIQTIYFLSYNRNIIRDITMNLEI